ncbi:MAG: hypothetical protein JXC36_08200 [Candidatus Atribacteria bacterium]|nr:hypothetical protein [Candidatus Atribacteria bacterium]
MEEIRKQYLDSKNKGADINAYGETFKVNVKLREKFPNSYFLSTIYDSAIRGVDLLTESIIYELTWLGMEYVWHIEDSLPDMGDRLECGGIVTNRISQLTPEQLDGKVPPTVMLLDDDMKEWEFVRRYIQRKRP